MQSAPACGLAAAQLRGCCLVFDCRAASVRCSPCSCVPGPFSAEAGLVLAQGVLLVSRTLLTEYVAFLEGRIGR